MPRNPDAIRLVYLSSGGPLCGTLAPVEKAFQDLRKNNTVFAKALSKYENNKNFNLNIGIDNAKVKAAGAIAVTETPLDKSDVLNSTTTNSYYVSSRTAESDPNYEYTDLGVVLIVAHEAVHQKIGLTKKVENSNGSHNVFNTERQTLENIIAEYSKDNNLNLSAEAITVLSFSGQQASTAFKSYLTNLAKENNTTYKEEKKKYDKTLSDLLYQKKSDTTK